ncbi:hypothetical protein [Paenibacillus rhizovicinus]|nr:hypothetical protein [Paenibacillus rhizovicinus]
MEQFAALVPEFDTTGTRQVLIMEVGETIELGDTVRRNVRR